MERPLTEQSIREAMRDGGLFALDVHHEKTKHHLEANIDLLAREIRSVKAVVGGISVGQSIYIAILLLILWRIW